MAYLLFSFRTLSSVFGAALQAVSHTGGIKRTTYDVITYTRQVFHTTATYHYDAVLLQVMTLTGNVSIHFLEFVRRTRATLRIAELGFLGVVV